ncbi:IS30 family transposase [Listeria monocytogenes]|nr:IS30 family transposase [Listeria monocytogenes]
MTKVNNKSVSRKSVDFPPTLNIVEPFKSITFDCGKEFSNWKAMRNQNDIDIYFADPGTPSQRALNEHSNGLLRRDGLVKAMDFNEVSESFIQAVASKRNHIPRNSLKYQTPMEIFLRNIKPDDLSNLIWQMKFLN